MTKQEIEQAKALRAQGKTYQEIGDIMCYSAGAIRYNIMDKVRRDAIVYNQIVLKGFYDYFTENKNITIANFAFRVFGKADHDHYYLLRRLLKGQNVKVTTNSIRRMIETTGKTFEELFEKRKGF